MAEDAQESPKKRRLRLALRWGIYLVLSLLLLNEATESGAIEECTGADASASVMSRSDYRTMVRLGIPDEAQSQKVVLVTIGSAEPYQIKSDYCAYRFFVARLIERLRQLNVSVIALDKLYEESACPLDGKETESLLQAVLGPVPGAGPVVTLAERTHLIPSA